MYIRTVMSAALAVTFLGIGHAAAQPGRTDSSVLRERARQPYRQGLEHMQGEAFAAAVKAFEAAVAIDATFDMAYYMMGRAHLAQKSYAAAVQALTKARSVYLAEAGREFVTKQDFQRHRRDRLASLQDTLQQLRAAVPQTFQILEQIRQLEERKRQVEDMDRSHDQTISTAVPAFVSLSLGSAYFRSGNMMEAEKAWRDAVAVDARAGEAHSNLAVVYMETGRLNEAERALKAAEKAGFKVNPQLKDEIKNRKKAGTD